MTLRQLHRMAMARQRAEWQRTAELLALVHNLFADKGSRVRARDLNPYAEQPAGAAKPNAEDTGIPWSALKAMFRAGRVR